MISIKKNNKSLLVIGAGITGLSTGIHALLKGYNVEIFEKNDFPGGCCTGWFREGYYIDNCMHWLTGTNQHTKGFKLWKKLGAISETSNLYQGEYFYKSVYDNNEIALSTDTKKLRKEMLDLSSADAEETSRFVDAIEELVKANQINNFICTPFVVAKGYLKNYLYYHKLSLGELSKKFKHPLLQRLFTDYFPSEYSSLSLICAYATFASGNGKVYEKGSKEFANNIAKKFISLGGIIHYNSNVTNIEITNNSFKSITANNQKFEGDFLISTIDPMFLFNNLIDNSYMPKDLKNKFLNKKQNEIVSSFHTAYLINQDTPDITETSVIEIEPTLVGKHTITRLLIKDYSYLYKDKDKKVVQLFIVQNMEDIEYWQDLYTNNKEEYKIVKENTTTNLTSALLNKLPNLKDNLHLLDSWTPVTYNSYFNTYYGSYMGFVFKKKGSIKKLSSKIKNIKNMRYVTYWQTYMGGLPIAARLGEAVVKQL